MIFGDVPESYAQYATSQIVILPVPYDKTSTWIHGADKGPAALFEAAEQIELYDIETDSEVYTRGIHITESVLESESPEQLVAAVNKRVTQLLTDKKFVVTLGGNHTVSIGAIQAHAAMYPDMTVVQFDAHADLRSSYHGSIFNHACVMAQVRKCCPAIQIGIRSMCSEERKVYDKERMFFAHTIHQDNEWMQKALSLCSNQVYITFDLDVFDSSLMPSTGTPEPGGLQYSEVIQFMRKLCKHATIVGCDITELCPHPDNKAPDYVAAKLLYQMLSTFFHEK